jgi:hypothetical protein
MTHSITPPVISVCRAMSFSPSRFHATSFVHHAGATALDAWIAGHYRAGERFGMYEVMRAR